jgi:hypothetical protein
MIFILIISLFAVAAAAFAIYHNRGKAAGDASQRVLAQPTPGGLFDDRPPVAAEGQSDASRERQALIERAAGGDLGALADAHDARDAGLYFEVLEALIEQASHSQESFRALVAHLSKSDEMRASVDLAARVIEEWKAAPDRRATVEMLHVAALSDDAATYLKAVEAILEYWQSGQLSSFTKDEVCDLVESQYWVLAPEARRAGAGFALKDRLAGVRRKLASAKPVS